MYRIQVILLILANASINILTALIRIFWLVPYSIFDPLKAIEKNNPEIRM